MILNILRNTVELRQDLLGELKKVAAFLNKTLSEEQFLLLREHLRFDNFKKNEAVNFEIGKSIGATNTEGHFIRKGNAVIFHSLHFHTSHYKLINVELVRQNRRLEKPLQPGTE